MSCLTETTSNKYIKFLDTNGTCVINPSEYISIYLGLSKRTTTSHAKKIAKVMYNASMKKEDGVTIFYLLNLIYNKKGDNHVTCLSFTKTEDEKGSLEFFDPNGELVVTTKKKKGYTPDDNLMNIFKEIENEMTKTYGISTTKTELLRGSGSLNNEGTGNCNTITLFYISLRSENKFSDFEDKFTISYLTMKKIKKLNKTITMKEMMK